MSHTPGATRRGYKLSPSDKSTAALVRLVDNCNVTARTLPTRHPYLLPLPSMSNLEDEATSCYRNGSLVDNCNCSWLMQYYTHIVCVHLRSDVWESIRWVVACMRG